MKFDLSFAIEILPALLRGAIVTAEATFGGMALALLGGLVLALGRRSKIPGLPRLSASYVLFMRNTPLLVQLYLFYFALAPILGIGRDLTGILALGLFEGAFAAEIIRAGILAVPAGQREAAASLGLAPRHGFAFVVLPQALRVALPPLTSLMVSLVKHSAIISAIAIFDLANEARNAISDTFMTFEIWLTVAAIYLLVATVLSQLASLLERRLARGRAL